MDKTNKIQFSEVTPAMIQDWKAKYGEHALHQITVPVAEGVEANFVARVPDMDVTTALARYGKENNFEKVNKLLVSNCLLAGDWEPMERYGNVFQAVLNRLGEIGRMKVSTLKKL